MGWHSMAAVQYTFIHKQYTEQHNETQYLHTKWTERFADCLGTVPVQHMYP